MKGIGAGIMAGILALCMAVPATAAAPPKDAIEVTTMAVVDLVHKNEKGEKTVVQKDVSAAKIVPGDVVTFTLTYTNRGTQPATGVVITNPVPDHMTYLDKSAEGKGTKIDFSVNRGKSYDAPDRLTVKDAQGKVRPARGQDYTHVRWVLGTPLAPGGSGTVSFKAQVK